MHREVSYTLSSECILEHCRYIVFLPTTHAIGRDEAVVRSHPISQRLRPLVFLLFQFTMKKNSLKT